MCVCEQGQESDSSETSVRGPRIKHVCRRAAVALGRNRAVFPDDMPTLSALPWEEREKILSSMGNDGETHSVNLSVDLHMDYYLAVNICQHYIFTLLTLPGLLTLLLLIPSGGLVGIIARQLMVG